MVEGLYIETASRNLDRYHHINNGRIYVALMGHVPAVWSLRMYMS